MTLDYLYVLFTDDDAPNPDSDVLTLLFEGDDQLYSMDRRSRAKASLVYSRFSVFAADWAQACCARRRGYAASRRAR